VILRPRAAAYVGFLSVEAERFRGQVRGALAAVCTLEAAMNLPTTVESSSRLIAEIERYLGVVELFRALSCEPDWHAEPVARLVVSRSRA
jgi:hypothetical protein